MKKIINVLLIVFILLLFYLTNDADTLSLVVSFSIFILFYSAFSTTSIKNCLEKYYNKKNCYYVNKIFKYSIICVAFLGVFLTIVAYLFGNFLKIEHLNIINIFMSLALVSTVLLKLVDEYLNVIGYKKISNNLINLYYILVLLINIILSILLFRVFKLNSYLNFILLYLVEIIVFIVLMLIVYLMIKKKKKKKKNLRIGEEVKIDYIGEIRGIFINNFSKTFSNIVKASYIYISVIILYYTLINRYNYRYELVDKLITNTYFYGLFIMSFIYKLINKMLNIDYNKVQANFNCNVNRLIKMNLNLSILLAVLSVPLNSLLFKNDYNILISLIPLLFVYSLYDYIVNVNIKYTKKRGTIIILLIGLFIKIIFELPLISSVYRMGYVLTSGTILSTIIGLLGSVIAGLIIIRNQFKLNLLDDFVGLLNIIYESIIYALVLIIFTLIVKIDRVGLMENIFIIVFYLFISFIFFSVKRILSKK